ncbi:hypothetical protein F4780DRAFT_489479 [Xylariomycetidae sp. FL0641]|nr:hypothetical protein F4780DRAFT_489479 [Xylariomycetidae sp. FL0641]
MTASAPMPQRQRQRKFHRRSRNGCSTCKAKHIRCDERKPLCTYCLRHGGDCGYPVDCDANSSDTTEGGQRSVSASTEPQERETLSGPPPFDRTPTDIFLGTSFDIPHKSRSLFQLFTSSRVLHSIRVQRDQDSFLIHRALSHPGFLHAALLMTTLHWAWSTGDVEQFRVPYLYHKVQAIRLALVETCLGTTATTAYHLLGLAKIKELQEGEMRPKKMGLLQRMILMAARSVSSRPVRDISDIMRTDSVHQSMVLSLLRVALRPIFSVFTLSGDEGTGEPLSDVMGRVMQYPEANDGHTVQPVRSWTPSS